MFIKDNLHQAKTGLNNTNLDFDATEYLINYFRTNE